VPVGTYRRDGSIEYTPKHFTQTAEQQAAEKIREHPSEQAEAESRAIEKGELEPGQGEIEEQRQYPQPGSWQEKTNQLLKSLLGDNWFSRQAGFVQQPEIRRAVRPPPSPASGVQVGQPQSPGGVGQPADQQMRNDPRVRRIKAEYEAGKFGPIGSQQAVKAAVQAIQALGYSQGGIPP
jgi:hypothetical protein